MMQVHLKSALRKKTVFSFCPSSLLSVIVKPETSVFESFFSEIPECYHNMIGCNTWFHVQCVVATFKIDIN